MRCATHPDVETNLRCGKCGTPICPRCLVQTPLGARCPQCAQLRRLPTYEVSPSQYLKALGTGWGLALVLGVVWGLLGSFTLAFFFYLNFLVALGVGFAIGEITGLSVNRKRGLGLQVIAGVGVFLSFVLGLFRFWPGAGLYFPMASLLNPWNWLVLALGVYIAVSRLR